MQSLLSSSTHYCIGKISPSFLQLSPAFFVLFLPVLSGRRLLCFSSRLRRPSLRLEKKITTIKKNYEKKKDTELAQRFVLGRCTLSLLFFDVTKGSAFSFSDFRSLSSFFSLPRSLLSHRFHLAVAFLHDFKN